MPIPFATQDQLTQRTSPANDQCVHLDAELLRQSIDGIQGEVSLSALDPREVPSRDAELLGETLLRQTARKAQIAHLCSEHLLERFCHTSSVMSGSHDFQEVITSSWVTHDSRCNCIRPQRRA